MASADALSLLPRIPFMIAEIGINHNGDMEIAKKLIDASKETGFDAVKFQKRTLDTVYTKDVLDSARESPWGTTQRQQKQGLEFGKREYDEINTYCRDRQIAWFASAWDLESQDFLAAYDCPYNKVASAMITYEPLLEKIAKEKRLTFISTGMAEFPAIDRAVEIFNKAGCPYILLHCVSTYPAQEKDLNLRCIETLRTRYRAPVGYSGHETGVMPSVVAVGLGAVVIERHVTLDRAMYGSDQAASLEKRGMELLVRDCRRVGTILGGGEKVLIDAEKGVAKKLRWFEAQA